MTSFTNDNVDKMVQDFKSFLNELHEFRRVHVLQGPTAQSLAISESTSFADPEKVMTAYSQGTMLLEVAEDQAESFIRCVADPALSFAVWTSVRAVLEACALSAWLLDRDINAKIRVQRSFAFRYEGLDQQLKLLSSIGDYKNHSKSVKRIDSIETSAIALGYKKLEKEIRGKKQRSGIGQVMPSITSIIRDVLDEEVTYRILSGVAHGHMWALHQLGMQKINKQSSSWDSIHADSSDFQKHLRPEGIAYLCVMTSNVFTKALWRASCLFGWNIKQLESVLEKNYDLLGFTEAVRHWKK